MRMTYDCIIVGGGMAGLTAGSYLSKAGRSVLLMEKESDIGGLVTSFEHGGFLFDGGIRAIEDSGIVRPMLRQLGIELEFLKSGVSIGFGRDVIKLSGVESLEAYRQLLCRQFPQSEADIGAIVGEIERVMEYMDVLYGIDNPLFLDLKKDPSYVFKTILPWLFKYLWTMPKVAKLQMPVDEYLARFTGNRALIDMIGQHFFKKTPTFFALSYFSLYLDYAYPRGGTGTLSASLGGFLRDHGGSILTGVEVLRVDPMARTVADATGAVHAYRKLIWAADLKALYRALDMSSIRDEKTRAPIAAKAASIADKRGGDSVLTVYLALDLAPERFSERASGHFFYTPSTKGLSTLDPAEIGTGGSRLFTEDKAAFFSWIGRFIDLNTFEISCPALRDPSLAPAGKTGLIVSLLMDYDLALGARERGWYEEFKDFCSKRIVGLLDAAIFPGLEAAVLDSFVSTPLSLAERTGNADGAITGWAFTNRPVPAVSSLPAIASSVRTPIPDVYQAGQWSYSPSGLPISILTGKLAADRVLKDLGHS
jgi:phytoene dehydrogenase-like protein